MKYGCKLLGLFLLAGILFNANLESCGQTEKIKTEDANAIDVNVRLISILQNFLKQRRPTAAEDRSQDNPAIELQIPGKKPSLFILPRITINVFEDYLFANRKFDELIIFSNAVIKSSPDVMTCYMLGEAYEVKGDIDGAINMYNKAASIMPNFEISYFRLYGIYLYDKNDADKANTYLTKYNSMKSNKEALIDNLMMMGNYCLNESREFDKAEKFFKMVLKVQPDYDRPKLNIAVCRINRSIPAQDKDVFDNAVAEIRNIAGTTTDAECKSFAENLAMQSQEIRKKAFGE